MNTKAVVGLVVVGLTVIIGYPKFRQARSASAAQDRNFLPNIIVDVNKRLPVNPEPDIVFYRADMKQGMVTYNMRIERSDANNTPPDRLADIRRRVTRIICDDPEAMKVRKAGGTVRGNISDRTGTPMGSVAVLPNGC